MLICVNNRCTCLHHQLIDRLYKRENDEAMSIVRKLENLSYWAESSGSSLLHYCAIYDNAEVSQYLIDKGTNVDVKNNSGATPLMLAVQRKNVATVEVLLNNKADIYSTDFSGVSCLQRAASRRLNSPSFACIEQNSHLVLKMFFDKVNEDFLRRTDETMPILLNANISVKIAAVAIGSVEVMKFLLDNDKKIRRYRYSPQQLGGLHWAIIFARRENVKMLMDFGFNLINPIANFARYYSLNFAHLDVNATVLKAWLKRASTRLSNHFNVSDSDKFTCELVYFLTRGNKATVKALLESKTNWHTMRYGYVNQGLLHLLIRNSNDDDDVIELLDELDITFDVNEVDTFGLTALELAARCIGDARKVEFLLKHGASVNSIVIRNDRPTIHDEAMNANDDDNAKPEKERNFVKIIELLLQYGADAQLVFDNGKTLIHWHDCLHKESLTIKVIIAHLALLGSIDKSKLTALSRMKIESQAELSDYFDLCTEQLEEMKKIEVCDTVTLFELLIMVEDEEKLIAYARNSEFNLAFKSIMENMSHLEFYYVDTLKSRIGKAIDQVELERKATLTIETLTGLCSVAHYAIIL